MVTLDISLHISCLTTDLTRTGNSDGPPGEEIELQTHSSAGGAETDLEGSEQQGAESDLGDGIQQGAESDHGSGMQQGAESDQGSGMQQGVESDLRDDVQPGAESDLGGTGHPHHRSHVYTPMQCLFFTDHF